MKRAVKYLTYSILVLALFTMLAALVMQTVFGSRGAVVYSGSMEPAMRVGGLAVIEPADPASIEVGDILAYNPEHASNVLMCHRVIEVIEGADLTFRTKGDANEDPDPWEVSAASVQGKVGFTIPYAGYALNNVGRWVRSKPGMALLILVPTVLLLGSAFRELAQNRRRRRQAQEASQEQQ